MAKNVPTKQVLLLVEALEKRGVEGIETEHWDGHKHIDIYIPNVQLYIEVDGVQHYTSPKQIVSDLNRDHFSDNDEFFTKHIPNELIDTHLEEIADALVSVIKKRKNTPH